MGNSINFKKCASLDMELTLENNGFTFHDITPSKDNTEDCVSYLNQNEPSNALLELRSIYACPRCLSNNFNISEKIPILKGPWVKYQVNLPGEDNEMGNLFFECLECNHRAVSILLKDMRLESLSKIKRKRQPNFNLIAIITKKYNCPRAAYKIAKECGVSPRYVYRLVSKLRKQGLKIPNE